MAAEVLSRVEELDALLAAGEMDRLGDVLSADYYSSVPDAGDPSAAERFTDLAVALRSGMPDLVGSLGEVQQDGDTVTASLTVRGTHTEDLWGAPGSGAVVAWTTPISIRLAGDGLAIRFDETTTPEIVGLLRQLHLVNPPDEMDLPTHYPVTLPDFLLKLVFTGQPTDKPCSHLDQIAVTEPRSSVCEQCVESGDIWPALRMCLVCGYVGCCDTAKNRHMIGHWESSGHPIMRSIRGEERWVWCYEDNAFFEGRAFDRLR